MTGKMHLPHEPLMELPSAVEPSDQELLREYAATGAEAPFARLVQRHIDLVFSAAFRQTGDYVRAQDISQAVFSILARKAPSLSRETVLVGWLFQAVRYAALDARKMDARRQAREHEAAQMQFTESIEDAQGDWQELAPLLDEGLATLGAKDRHAVLLRFFEKKSFGEIGETLGGNENSARVRVVRAVDKLRLFFRRRGIAVSAATLSAALLTNAVQAAPPAMAALLVPRATGAMLVETVLRRFLWRRLLPVGVALVLLLLMGMGVALFVRQREATQAAALVDAARSARELMIAIDRTYTLNDPNGFVTLLHFRNPQEAQSAPVLGNYVRAQQHFRDEMARVFNVRQRAFNATFSELCTWRPQQPTTYIRPESVATNIMMAKYPLRLVKTDGAWKWDLFYTLSPEAAEERVRVLRHKAGLLEKLAGQIHDGTATNAIEILETVRIANP